MTIKAFAFEVQSRLSQASGIDLKRSHIHEVLAALFGYASYAAMSTQRVLAQHDGSVAVPLDISRAATRAADLGYAPPAPPLIAGAIATAADAERLCVITMDAVLTELGIEVEGDVPVRVGAEAHGRLAPDDGEEQEDLDVTLMFAIERESNVLRESLNRMANAGSASAHLALAQIDDEVLSEYSEGSTDGRYWYELQQAGRELGGVELDWANAYRHKLDLQASRDSHLRLAISLGNAEAALTRLESDPSVENFEHAARLAGPAQASRLGHLALFFQREEDARTSLRIAARRGDTASMKMLADGLEPELKDAWTWVHLAKLLGVNVMASHAVGDDGLPADADEAGPIYAAGGFELDPFSDQEDAEALAEARRIYDGLSGERFRRR
jgi:hypothetical protein